MMSLFVGYPEDSVQDIKIVESTICFSPSVYPCRDTVMCTIFGITIGSTYKNWVKQKF